MFGDVFLTYKGHSIRVIFPSGYHEIYHVDRFLKFDTAEGCEDFIDEIEESSDDNTNPV
jgi:hypothetical protein